MTSPRGLRSLSRVLSLALIAHTTSGCWFVVDSFDDAPTGAGGTAGASGSAGASGASGASGSAGSAGSAGAPCRAGTFDCRQNALYQCDTATGEYTQSQDCGTGSCDRDQGRCLTCKPGVALGCVNNKTLSVCDPDGLATSAQDCGAKLCQEGPPARCVECLQDSDCGKPTEDCYRAACLAGVCTKAPIEDGQPDNNHQGEECRVSRCDGKGSLVQSPVAVGQSCGSGGVCNGKGACGVCHPGDATTPAAARCDSTHSTQTCNADGQWAESVACPVGKPACRVSGCAGVTSMCLGTTHSCAVMSDGTVSCWGSNLGGELGSSILDDSSVIPVPVEGLVDVTDVQCGFLHTCALTKQGAVYCWGTRVKGLLGDGSTDSFTSTPTKVFDSGATSLSCADTHTCLTDSLGDVYCWGENEGLKLGQPAEVTKDDVLVPTRVVSSAKFKLVAVGEAHSCAISDTDDVYCWGDNYRAQLGADPQAQMATATPTMVKGLPKVDRLSVGWYHNVVRERTTVSPKVHWFWGSNSSGECMTDGEPTPTVQPPEMYDGNDGKDLLTSIKAGTDATFVLYGVATFARGANSDGQLGSGKKTSSGYELAWIDTPANLNSLYTGPTHTCAIQSSGRVYCWGQGDRGQLGHGDKDEHLSPVEVIW